MKCVIIKKMWLLWWKYGAETVIHIVPAGIPVKFLRLLCIYCWIRQGPTTFRISQRRGAKIDTGRAETSQWTPSKCSKPAAHVC